jgi:hypothetical protein
MLVSNRATNILLVLILAIGIGIVAMLASGARGGPLDPPGAPAPTDGVRRAGTPISDTPLTITQPGVYYLTRDITGGASEFGIRIESSDVTVDLGGFTLRGGANPGNGIEVVQPHLNVAIRDGSVRNWFAGIVGGAYGRIDHVSTLTNSGIGMSVQAHSDILDCQSSGNGGQGILVNFSVVRGCTVTDNNLQGIWVLGNSLVQENKVRNNAAGTNLHGIESAAGSRSTIVGNEISGNAGGRGVGTASTDILYNNFICDDTNSIAAGSNLGNIAPASC